MKAKQFFIPIFLAFLGYVGAQEGCEEVCGAKVAEGLAEIERLKGQLASAEAKVKTYADSMAANAASHAKDAHAMAKDVAAANAKVAELSGSRFNINTDLIQEDIDNLLATMNSVRTKVNVNGLLEKVNVNGLLEKVNMKGLLEKVNVTVNGLLEKVNVTANGLLEKATVTVNGVLEKLDISGFVEKLEFKGLLKKAGLAKE